MNQLFSILIFVGKSYYYLMLEIVYLCQLYNPHNFG